MSTYNQPTEKRGGIPVPAVIAAVIIALGVLGYSGYKFLGPPAPAPMDAAGEKNKTYIQGLVKQSNGDYGKVSAEDKAKLEQMTMGHGAMAFGSTKKDMGMK